MALGSMFRGCPAIGTRPNSETERVSRTSVGTKVRRISTLVMIARLVPMRPPGRSINAGKDGRKSTRASCAVISRDRSAD